MSKITDKQEKFAYSIATGEFKHNWEAYEAHYDTSKMSQNAIYVEACRLIQNPNVALRIKEIQEETEKRNQATLDEVLNMMADWLRFDPLEMFDDYDCVKSIKDLPKHIRTSISEIQVQEQYKNTSEGKVKIGEVKRIKFIDKRATADMIMKKSGAYVERKEIRVDGSDELKDIIGGIKD